MAPEGCQLSKLEFTQHSHLLEPDKTTHEHETSRIFSELSSFVISWSRNSETRSVLLEDEKTFPNESHCAAICSYPRSPAYVSLYFVLNNDSTARNEGQWVGRFGIPGDNENLNGKHERYENRLAFRVCSWESEHNSYKSTSFQSQKLLLFNQFLFLRHQEGSIKTLRLLSRELTTASFFFQ